MTTAIAAQKSSSPTAEAPTSRHPWFSGHCGGGTQCFDGQFTNKVGEPIQHCRGYSINGYKAAVPYLTCACQCHQPGSVGISADDFPDFTPIIKAWEKSRSEQ